MGSVSPAGETNSELWNAVTDAKPLFTPVEGVEEDFKVKLAGQLKSFDPDKYMDPKLSRRMGKFTQFAVAAARLALDDSGLEKTDFDRDRTAVIVGTGIGGAEQISNDTAYVLEHGYNRVSPTLIPSVIPNMATGYITQLFDLRGECYAVARACATGAHAIGEAYRSIKHGYSDYALAGGTEAGIFPLGLAGFANMKALSLTDDPNLASLPFDKRRSGFVMSEGAAIVVMESLESALARGAHIYAEISGYGATADAYHFTSPRPDGQGASKAMKAAMADAGLTAADIDYINAHGTGTPINDKYETVAIKDALGEYASKVAVSSSKGVIGHMLGAAGAIECMITALSLHNGVIPPTAGLYEQDEECDLDCVPLRARKADIRAALSNSLAFGGANASLVLKKYEK